MPHLRENFGYLSSHFSKSYPQISVCFQDTAYKILKTKYISVYLSMFESLFWVSLIEVSIIFEMEKDYFRSKKYTQDQLDNLDIPYKFRDFCQEDYADYTSCVRTHPRVFENSFVYSAPFSEAISSCKILRKKWLKCEDYREKELFEEMKKIYDLQRELV